MSSASPVACLLRVSTKDQSVDPQRQAILKWCEEKGHPPPREYVEHGVSGASKHRPVLDRLMRDAARGGIKIVVVAAVDRLARDTLRVFDAVIGLGEHGVAVVSLREPFIDGTGLMGRALLGFCAVFAELERQTIRDRINAGIKAAKARGVHCGRPGYRWDDEADESLRVCYEVEGLSPEQIVEAGRVKPWLRRRRAETGLMEEMATVPSPTVIRDRVKALGLVRGKVKA